ncbi:MAG: hypothetical protein HYV09_38525 [Deltaproteobacteria bacterium]|nr:hypothetical protein [Deltaproteobacteria bacterium]
MDYRKPAPLAPREPDPEEKLRALAEKGRRERATLDRKVEQEELAERRAADRERVEKELRFAASTTPLGMWLDPDVFWGLGVGGGLPLTMVTTALLAGLVTRVAATVVPVLFVVGLLGVRIAAHLARESGLSRERAWIASRAWRLHGYESALASELRLTALRVRVTFASSAPEGPMVRDLGALIGARVSESSDRTVTLGMRWPNRLFIRANHHVYRFVHELDDRILRALHDVHPIESIELEIGDGDPFD